MPQRANVIARKTAPHSADSIRMARGAWLAVWPPPRGLHGWECPRAPVASPASSASHATNTIQARLASRQRAPRRSRRWRPQRTDPRLHSAGKKSRPGGELPQGGVWFHPQARRLARSLCQTLLPRQFVGDAPGEHQRPAHVQPREAGRVDVGVGAAAVVAVGEQAADGVALLIPRPRGSRWPTGRSAS